MGAYDPNGSGVEREEVFVESQLFAEMRKAFESESRRIAVCGAGRGRELKQRIESLHEEGKIHSGVYETYLTSIADSPPESVRGAESLLLVASPQGRSILVLDLPEGPFESVIPATYLVDRIRAKNRELLEGILGARGIAFGLARLPLKTFAGLSGLGRYGRDNVIRVEGMGSYVRLDAYWIRAALGEGRWGEPELLERCASCRACARACPYGCIRDEDFAVDASRCLTFWNECPDPFPAWLRPEAHNATVGCMRCQEACPENAPFRTSVDLRVQLDRQSSLGLMEGRPAAELPEGAALLVRALGFEGLEGALARNLKALRGRKAAAG
jgi:epoxyqueuosine reductase